MQLILMKDTVSCEEDRYMLDLTVSGVHIYKDKVTWRDCKDEVAQKIISELFSSEEEGVDSDDSDAYLPYDSGTLVNSELKVKMENRGYDLILKHGRGNKILKRLRKRFYDKVKISVTVEEDGHAPTSSEQMEISSKYYKCAGSIDLDGIGDGCFEFDVLMTITAHILLSDEEILASSQLSVPRKIFEDALFADVTISAKDGSEVKAHKSFLSAASPVFRAIFANEFEESKTGKLDMPDLSEKGLKAFLRFIYYRDLEQPKEDLELAYELLQAAHKYNVFALEAWVREYLLDMEDEDFTVDLAFAIYTFVRNIEAGAELKKKTAQILMTNVDEMENLKEYKELEEGNSEAATELRKELDYLAPASASPTPNKKQKLSK